MSTLNQGPRGPHSQPGTLSRQRNSCVRDLKKLIYFSTFFDGVDVADQRSFAVPVLVAVLGVVDGRVVDLLHGRRQLLQLLGVDLGSKQRVNRDAQVVKLGTTMPKVEGSNPTRKKPFSSAFYKT